MTVFEDDPVSFFKDRLAGDLPGHDHFLEYTSYKREHIDAALLREKQPRLSAVLICLHKVDTEWHTVLIKRPEYDGVHSGQIAFPGGRMEPEDIDLFQTAKREFTEETGADASEFDLVGELSELYIPPSRSMVTPYMAVTEKKLVFSPDESEVARLFSIPLKQVLDKDILKYTEKHVLSVDKLSRVPYFDIANEIVWGATAMMIAELRKISGLNP